MADSFLASIGGGAEGGGAGGGGALGGSAGVADSSSEEEGEGGGAQARLSKRALKKQRKEELEAAAVIEGQPIASGIGHALLQKMGWGDGQGLGKNAEGIVEPVKAAAAAWKRGLAADDE